MALKDWKKIGIDKWENKDRGHVLLRRTKKQINKTIKENGKFKL